MVAFFSLLEDLFGDPARRPQGRLVLGFRKEWFPEIQKQFEDHGLDYGKVFLEGLDRDAILEVITGLTRTPRLRERYGLEVEAGLPELIAGHLLADRNSPIAPTLQILLTRMWQDATAESPSAPRFTHSLYGRLRDEGYLLGDFLEPAAPEAWPRRHLPRGGGTAGRVSGPAAEKLGNAPGLEGWSERSAEERAEIVESGLVLDILAYHTTPLLTAEQRTEKQLQENYRHRAGILPLLVQAMKACFCSRTHQARERRPREVPASPTTLSRRWCGSATTLSAYPGQRARRILESRGAEWRGGRTAAPLDAWDLKVVEAGLPGMRALQPDEERLLAASRREGRRRRRNLWLLRAAGLAVLAGLGVVFWLAGRVKERNRLLATSYEVQRYLAVEPASGLTEAISATGDSLDQFDEVFTPVQLSLLRAVEEAREGQVFVHGAAITDVAAAGTAGRWPAPARTARSGCANLDGGPARVLPQQGTVPRALAFSRDGLAGERGQRRQATPVVPGGRRAPRHLDGRARGPCLDGDVQPGRQARRHRRRRRLRSACGICRPIPSRRRSKVIAPPSTRWSSVRTGRRWRAPARTARSASGT